MKYRDYCGALGKSPVTIREISSMAELKEHLGPDVEEMRIQYYGYDARIDWDTYAIYVKYNGGRDFKIAGFLDGKKR